MSRKQRRDHDPAPRYDPPHCATCGEALDVVTVVSTDPARPPAEQRIETRYWRHRRRR